MLTGATVHPEVLHSSHPDLLPPLEATVFRKSLVAVSTAALVLSGGAATASAQSAAPYPSSEIPVEQSWVQAVQNIAPAAPADQIHAGLQIGTAWGTWVLGSSALSFGSSVLGLGSSALLAGSAL